MSKQRSSAGEFALLMSEEINIFQKKLNIDDFIVFMCKRNPNSRV